MLAYDYPLLGMFWTFLWFFLWIAWIVVLFRVIFDIFRSKDMGGVGKALWVIFVIFLPFLGVLVYLIARPEEKRTLTCPGCAREVGDGAFCPHCGRDLSRSFCPACRYPLQADWTYCPACRTDVRAQPPAGTPVPEGSAG